jgi:hypothetical protein
VIRITKHSRVLAQIAAPAGACTICGQAYAKAKSSSAKTISVTQT